MDRPRVRRKRQQLASEKSATRRKILQPPSTTRDDQAEPDRDFEIFDMLCHQLHPAQSYACAQQQVQLLRGHRLLFPEWLPIATTSALPSASMQLELACNQRLLQSRHLRANFGSLEGLFFFMGGSQSAMSNLQRAGWSIESHFMSCIASFKAQCESTGQKISAGMITDCDRYRIAGKYD